MRYYDPVAGKVTFDGQGQCPSTLIPRTSSLLQDKDIREFKTSSWRSVIGVVPQDPVLFTGTIASNIAYGDETYSREQIEEAAREANCEFIWGMPNGFDTKSMRYNYLRLLA